MQTTLIGRLSVWLGAALLALGLFFSNIVIIALSGFLILIIIYHGLLIRRIYSLAHPPISLRLHSPVKQTSTERSFPVETMVQNKIKADLRIVEFKLEVTDETDQETFGLGPLPKRGESLLTTNLTSHAEGVLDVKGVTLVLEKRPYLFSQTFRFDENIQITIRPTTNGGSSLTGLDTLSDLRSDPIQRGYGSELAGLRPFNFLDDFHSVDWKATARTGKMMTKEYFLERESPIILLIDVSVLQRSDGSENAATLLKQLWSILEDHQLSTNPIGLILVDQLNVNLQIELGIGLANRERIAQALLANIGHEREKATLPHTTPRLLSALVQQIATLEKGRESARAFSPFREKVRNLAENVLPFLEKARSDYLAASRKQGAFKAFEVICALMRPTLVIAISNGKQNIDGLLEGAKVAAAAGCQVIIVFLEPAPSIFDSGKFAQGGLQIVTCEIDDMWRSVSEAILTVARVRVRQSAISEIASRVK